VAHNLALKQRAKQHRSSVRTLSLRFAASVPDPVPDPERDLVRTERHNRLTAVLRALPDRDRHCVRLYAAGLRYRDIARVLGISLGAVSKSLVRAIARLRRADER
jgi:RNA polymerase sigma-70 factor (ECF subfamily)